MVNIKKNQIKPIFIAEVGQNHQGSLKKALEYVRVFSKLGAHIIKFQNRNNKYLFSTEAYKKEYFSVNSFAKTYGKHREKLELSYKDLKKIRFECKKNGVDFMCTPFDEPSVELLKKLKLNFVKISSFEIGNLPFINLIGKKFKTVFISTGGANIDQIKQSIKILRKNNVKIILMHCVSEYPCPDKNLGLLNLKKLKKLFPYCIIGNSDHFAGILSGPVAYLLGARVFEKHVTFDRTLKGSDHNFSLEPDGFKKFVRDTERVRLMLKPKKNSLLGKEKVFQRLGKSIIANRNLKKGDKVSLNNISGKIFHKTYIPVRDTYKVLGKKLKIDISKNEPITKKYF